MLLSPALANKARTSPLRVALPPMKTEPKGDRFQAREDIVVTLRRLRRDCDRSRTLIRAEAQEGGDVAGAIELFMVLEIEQFYVATDGDGNDGVTNIGEFASAVSTGDTRRDQMRIDVAAVLALDRWSRIIFPEEHTLHFPGFERPQDATKSGDPTPVRLCTREHFSDFHRGTLSDPLIEKSMSVISNLFVRHTGHIGGEAANHALFDVWM